MKKYDVIIIGGSAAGTVAALTARKFYPTSSILLIRDIKNVPIPCGIPYVFGTVGDSLKNLIPVDTMMAANNIEVLVGKVTKINAEFKLVLAGQQEGIQYERLILATGSVPLVPPLSGINKQNVFVIKKDPAYLDGIMKQMDAAKNLVIIGGGFIGVELAEESRKRRPDLSVTIVEMQEHCLQLVYDPEFCALAETELRNENITLHLQGKVVGLVGENAVEGVQLADGTILPADMVLFGIGCVANVDLALEAGLKIGPTRGIFVDGHMRTSDESIFACGDCAEKVSFFNGQPSGLKLASIATMEARIAGANLFKDHRKNSGTLGCFSTVLNQKAFACVGLTETHAKSLGYDVVCGEAESINRHPGALPGGAMMKVKLVFLKEKMELLGGEIFGALSGGELINALSGFISQKVTADEIALFQAATHPCLTASPIAYPLVTAAENALKKTR